MAQKLEELTKLTKRLANPVVVSPPFSKYNPSTAVAEWCSGSTGEFGSLSPGSIPGSAAILTNPLTHTAVAASNLLPYPSTRASLRHRRRPELRIGRPPTWPPDPPQKNSRGIQTGSSD